MSYSASTPTVPKPTIVISFDFELGWGALDTNYWKKREAAGVYVRLRDIFTNLMPIIRNLEIPTTWAFVAGMLDDEKHRFEHLPQSYKNSAVEFVSCAQEKTRDARDLLDQWNIISKYSEVATHTYSHIYPSFKDTTAGIYVEDVSISLDVLERVLGVRPSTIIFPRDQANFLAEINATHNLDSRLNPHFDRTDRDATARAVDSVKSIMLGAPASRIITREKLSIHQTGSMYYNWVGGKYEFLKSLQLALNERKMLKHKAGSDCIHHIWLHPYNLSESSKVYKSFVAFLRKITSLRDQGSIQILTMRDLSDQRRKELLQ